MVMGTIAAAMACYYLSVLKFYDPRSYEDDCNKPASIQVRNVLNLSSAELDIRALILVTFYIHGIHSNTHLVASYMARMDCSWFQLYVHLLFLTRCGSLTKSTKSRPSTTIRCRREQNQRQSSRSPICKCNK